jgi:hypothetical protein
VFKNWLCSVHWFLFLSFWPFTLGACNFHIYNLFSTIVSVSDAPRGGVQVLLGHQKQQSPPLGCSLPWALKCSVTGRSTLPTWILVSPFQSKRLQLPTPAFNIVQVAFDYIGISLVFMTCQSKQWKDINSGGQWNAFKSYLRVRIWKSSLKIFSQSCGYFSISAYKL